MHYLFSFCKSFAFSLFQGVLLREIVPYLLFLTVITGLGKHEGIRNSGSYR